MRMFWGRAPEQELCLPSKVCAPKKVTGSVPRKCSSRPETPKILVVTPEFVSKICFFADFVIKTLFLWFHPRVCENLCIFWDEKLFLSSPQNSRKSAHILRWRLFFGPHSLIQSINFMGPPLKISLCPPKSRYLGTEHDLQIAKMVFRDIPPKCWLWVGQDHSILWALQEGQSIHQCKVKKNCYNSEQYIILRIKFIVPWKLN